MSTAGRVQPGRRDARAIGVAVLGLALVTWIVTVQRMRGMDAGPGTYLGGLGSYLGVWVAMMAAIMLPSAAPMLLMFNRVSAERRRRKQTFSPTSVFALAHLAASS